MGGRWRFFFFGGHFTWCGGAWAVGAPAVLSVDWAGAPAEAGFLTNVRHQGLVQESLAALDAASKAVGNKVPHEMLLLDLYNALRPLDAVTGATTTAYGF